MNPVYPKAEEVADFSRKNDPPQSCPSCGKSEPEVSFDADAGFTLDCDECVMWRRAISKAYQKASHFHKENPVPHYKSGEEARVGDQVRGRGYNVKSEIVGTVVGIVPGAGSCNLQVAHAVAAPIPDTRSFVSSFFRVYQQTGVIGCGPNGGQGGECIGAYVSLEYGQADAFELVCRDEEIQAPT